MKRIPLTNGGHALVDDEDYERVVAAGRWYGEMINGVRYAVRQFGRRRNVRMHRFILDPPRRAPIDHLNGDGLDNRRFNLRVCTYSQNHRNRDKARSDSQSGIRGVAIAPSGRFAASIRTAGVRIYLGTFDTIAEAADARRAAEERLWSDDDNTRARAAWRKR